MPICTACWSGRRAACWSSTALRSKDCPLRRLFGCARLRFGPEAAGMTSVSKKQVCRCVMLERSGGLGDRGLIDTATPVFDIYLQGAPDLRRDGSAMRSDLASAAAWRVAERGMTVETLNALVTAAKAASGLTPLSCGRTSGSAMCCDRPLAAEPGCSCRTLGTRRPHCPPCRDPRAARVERFARSCPFRPLRAARHPALGLALPGSHRRPLALCGLASYAPDLAAAMGESALGRGAWQKRQVLPKATGLRAGTLPKRKHRHWQWTMGSTIRRPLVGQAGAA